MSAIKGNLVGGEWHVTQDVCENRNPANPDDLIGLYAQADIHLVRRAVAVAAQEQPRWAAASPQVRADVLHRAGELILRRAEEIARLLAREEGKTLAEARGEVQRAGQIFLFFSGEAVRLYGQRVPSIRDGCDVDVRHEPLGVVGLITPWNFPIAIPAWKTAPALAAGNAVLLKPAALTPGCAFALAEILSEAGCPPGVFNLVMGSGHSIGSELVSHPDVAAISFTGSEAVGRELARGCAKTMKKVQLEMGGKNPMIVLDDADLDLAVDACINGAFYSTGQRCTASSRLIVTASIHDAFVVRMAGARADLRIGDPLEPETEIGPVVSERQLDINLGFVDRARSEGCDVLGGGRLDRPGFFQAPALFLGATNSMRSAREEIFGPCASVIKVADFDEAVAVANDTPYGLSSGICTRSLKYASRFKQMSSSGMVMVNLPTAGVDYHVPFGGRKASSLGTREQGPIAMQFYTSVKTTYTFAG